MKRLCAILRRAAIVLAATLTLSGCDTVREIISSISDGASCSSDSVCLGNSCLGEDEGFPGGYCTTRSCDTEGCSNIFGSECLTLGDVGTACFVSCSSRQPCREGYDCVSIETSRVCLPVGLVEGAPRAGRLGTACGNAADCETGTCLTNLIGGYCSTFDCEGDDTCPDDGRCLPLEEVLTEDDVDGAEDTEETGVSSPARSRTACFASCENDDACRFGYRCMDPDGSGGVCRPVDEEERSPVRNPEGAADGEPCRVDINCRGGTCLPDAADYPDGYCTTLNCAQVGCNSPSEAEAVCRVLTEDTACFSGCAQDADCRTGYACIEGDEGESGYCAPRTEVATPDELEDDDADIPVSCRSEAIDGGRRLRFNVDAQAVSFTVVPYSQSDQVRPRVLRGPNEEVLADFRTDHSFMALNPDLLVNMAPVFFPAAPQFAEIVAVGGGEYSLEVATRDDRPCFYLLQKTATGREIDLNFYLLGVPDISADNAWDNQDFVQMMEVFERIYDLANIRLRELRLIDVTGERLERFRIIRSFNDVFALASTTEPPGPSLRERLSVNVFFIEGFSVSEAPGLLGLSLGIPGVPAFHGNVGAGLIFTSEYLPDDPGGIGQTLAHEIGHYLGLRHTTEHGGNVADPLEDTPRCSNPDRGASCPDAENFMFPFGLRGVTQEHVSDGQGFVLRRSPFTQR